MTFPHIVNQAEFQSQVGNKPEIRFTSQSNGIVVGCYMVAMESTFDNKFAEECRGICFNDGKVASRPLHKFYNLNERDGSREFDFDWTQVQCVMPKRDGSMIQTVAVNKSPFSKIIFEGEQFYPIEQSFDVKSKKSFGSEVAEHARQFILKSQELIAFCEFVTNHGCTAIFEWTSPSSRIVLDYKKDQLQLLHIRHNKTGEYWPQSQLKVLANQYKIETCDRDASSDELQSLADNGINIVPQLIELANTLEGIEGWVIQFNDGRMVKVKTKQYLELHRVLTFLRERDIALMVIREQLDDLKSTLYEQGVDPSEVLEIESRVVSDLNQIRSEIAEKLSQTSGMDRKQVALKFGPSGEGFKYFGLLMHAFNGKEINIEEWYEKHVIPTVSLRSLNLSTMKAE